MRGGLLLLPFRPPQPRRPRLRPVAGGTLPESDQEAGKEEEGIDLAASNERQRRRCGTGGLYRVGRNIARKVARYTALGRGVGNGGDVDEAEWDRVLEESFGEGALTVETGGAS